MKFKCFWDLWVWNKSSSGNAFANQSNPFATSSTNSGFGGFGAFKNTGASSNASSQQSGFGGFGAKSDAPSQLSAFGSTGLGNTTNTTTGFGSSVLEVQDLPNQHLHLIVVLVLAGLEPRVTQQLQHLDSLDLDHQDFCRQIPATAAVCHLDKWENTNKPSPFGTTASQPSAFGSTATQPSNNKPSPFGQTNTSNSPFVSNTAATTAPTNTSSPFGSSNNNTSNPFGGQSSTSSPFGQTQHLLLHLVPAIKPICIWNGINSKYKSGIWVKQFSIDYREH